ncbi:sugar phosphate permease [Maribacter vaceletii]|uniref:Sugar phosphate permease n=1 Tax=Maribacter vaceletii TaxID=1206816 RepID=A0A495EEY8_9FLAO|nr:MFS transporter [Maribacter vaceletii]RKR15221.1 sugar phosphate permease [Maribacter vaceletii]
MNFSNLKEFKFGWPVILSSTFGIGLGMSPLPFYTIGVFAIPLSKNFGWGMDTVMGGLTVFTLSALIASPLIGYIADKVSARKTAMLSLLLFGISFIAFSLNTGSKVLYYTLWGVMAFAGAGTLPMTWTRVINNWFNENRGLALGLSLLGTGLFGAFAKLFAFSLIENFDWKTAYLGVGLLPILIALPLAYFFFRDIDDPKVAKKLKKLKDEVPSHATTTKSGMTVKEAFKDWKFWLLAFCFILISFAVGGPIPNLENLLSNKGFNTGDAVILASVIGYSVLMGRLIGGYLLDRFWAPAVAFILLSIPAISCYILQGADLTYANALIAVVILGFGAGVEYDLMAYLVSRYFGMKNYAAIYGFLYGFFAFGAGFGPVIFGKFFASTGSYDSILHYAMMAFLVGSFPLLLLGKYRNFDVEKK